MTCQMRRNVKNLRMGVEQWEKMMAKEWMLVIPFSITIGKRPLSFSKRILFWNCDRDKRYSFNAWAWLLQCHFSIHIRNHFAVFSVSQSCEFSALQIETLWAGPYRWPSSKVLMVPGILPLGKEPLPYCPPKPPSLPVALWRIWVELCIEQIKKVKGTPNFSSFLLCFGAKVQVVVQKCCEVQHFPDSWDISKSILWGRK